MVRTRQGRMVSIRRTRCLGARSTNAGSIRHTVLLGPTRRIRRTRQSHHSHRSIRRHLILVLPTLRARMLFPHRGTFLPAGRFLVTAPVSNPLE